MYSGKTWKFQTILDGNARKKESTASWIMTTSKKREDIKNEETLNNDNNLKNKGNPKNEDNLAVIGEEIRINFVLVWPGTFYCKACACYI